MIIRLGLRVYSRHIAKQNFVTVSKPENISHVTFIVLNEYAHELLLCLRILRNGENHDLQKRKNGIP